MFRRLLSGSDVRRGSGGSSALGQCVADHPGCDGPSHNTITELQVLSGHTDIVRHAVLVDDRRLASASDDGTLCVWDHVTGELLASLTGHTLPITCLARIDHSSLITGSSDKTLRVWDARRLCCAQVLSRHRGSVSCVARIDPDFSRFVTGGSDKFLHLWARREDGVVAFSGTIERSEEENLTCMLSLNSRYLVTGSSSSSVLVVYSLESARFHRVLSYHRESPQCLVQLSGQCFASGSLDGMIVVWTAETLTPLKVLANPENFVSREHTFSFRVRQMLPLSPRHLAVAAGNGFVVYDASTGEILLKCEAAHDGPVTCLLPLRGGSRLLTASADSCVKMWAMPQPLLDSMRPSPLPSPVSTPGSGRKPQKQQQPLSPMQQSAHQQHLRPELVGDMWGHSNSVQQLVALSEHSFASCSADKTVILWKDGDQQLELRSNFATHYLLRQQQQRRRTQSEAGGVASRAARQQQLDEEVTSPPSSTSPADVVASDSYCPRSFTAPDLVSLLNATSPDPSLCTNAQSPVPRRVYDEASSLLHDGKLSPRDVSKQLVAAGQDEGLVDAVIRALLGPADDNAEAEAAAPTPEPQPQRRSLFSKWLWNR